MESSLEKVNRIRRSQGAPPLSAAELAERRAKHLGPANHDEPVQAPAVSELDRFEQKARAAARKLKGGK
jgi:hypothetical protein